MKETIDCNQEKMYNESHVFNKNDQFIKLIQGFPCIKFF